MIKNILELARDILLNFFLSKKYDLVYIVENGNWSINWDGKYITKNLNEQKLIRSKTSTTHIGLRNKLIHFGSINTLISSRGIKKIHPSNKAVLTWFHITSTDERISLIPRLNKAVEVIHTSCNFTKEKLSQYGATADKVVVIPLGVDLNIFRPYQKNRIQEIKKQLELPEQKIIIGSFQKDGAGWKEGLIPKLEKGPDIFCDVVEKISKKYPIHILLTGPARGYVKKRLRSAKITYTHKFLKNYLDIVDYYNVLDLYLITSREEGGPKALLECLGCNIPIVSTRIGMVADFVDNREDLIICEKDDVSDIFDKALLFFENKNPKNRLTENGQNNIKKYSWENIASDYYYKIYKKLGSL